MRLFASVKYLLGVMSLCLVTFAFAGYGDMADKVRDRGFLKCGVSTGLVGFSTVDSLGNWDGVDVDVCRAVAAAVLGDSKKVEFTPLTAAERFTALSSGEIDVLSRNTTWTFLRDSNIGIIFAGVNYYDGAGFMVRKNLGIKDAKELRGATICVQSGTTTEQNLSDFFRSNNIPFRLVTIDDDNQAKESFESGRCDAYATDQSALFGTKTTLKDPESAVILPNIISEEPLGPVIAQGDQEWHNIVKWSLNAMIVAENLGVTSRNVSGDFNSPEIKRMLGRTNDFEGFLRLPKFWAFNIIKQVGNYGESFEKHIGVDTPIGLERGKNALWTKGGILYAPPFR